ncbi:MAG: hypothetical protein Q9219_004302 [cf. Caloplaca sp. 3 TL-2023]
MNPLLTLRTTLRPLPLLHTRLLSTTAPTRKSAVDAAKDTAKNVDRTISDAAVKGIEKGEQAAAAAKQSIGLNASKASGAAQETSGELKGKASELNGEAKGKAQEMSSSSGNMQGKMHETAGEVKGKASEVMGETKGKAQEMAGAAKGKAEEVKGKM